MATPAVFASNYFTMESLTASINKAKFSPGRIARLGLFREFGVATNTVIVEERDGVLTLIPTTAWGAPPHQHMPSKRKARSFVIPHLATESVIKASEVVGVRAFGSENMLEGPQQVVDRHTRDMARSLEATLEHLRIGAIKGTILDADGSTVIYNLFDEYGISQHAAFTFAFDNTTDTGVIAGKCDEIKREMEDTLDGAMFDHVHAFMSAGFAAEFHQDKEVRDSYREWQQGRWLREGHARFSFEWGGIFWEEYRGSVGGVDFVPADKALIFPVGVENLFINPFAPADFWETVNTIGMPRYSRLADDPSGMNRQRTVHAQSNPLPLCTRPEVLFVADFA